MTIKLQYKHLKGAADFLLNDVGAKGKKNIHRMRVVKALQEQLKKFAEEEVQLLKEYVEVDDNGDLVTENGNFKVVGNAKEFNKQQQEMFDEYFVLDDSNLASALETVQKLVNDFNKELYGQAAEMHYILVEAFEEGMKEDEE